MKRNLLIWRYLVLTPHPGKGQFLFPRPPHWSMLIALVGLSGLLCQSPLAAETNTPATTPTWLTQPLSMPDALAIALRQNSTILKGQSDLQAAYGVIVQTRAIAYPKLRASAGYIHDEGVEQFPFYRADSIIIHPPKNDYAGDIRIIQSIYEGGRIRSSLRTARLTREQALLQFQAVIADTLLEVRTAYYDILLAEQQIAVQAASVNLLANQLTNTVSRFEAGTVPRFDVLRAEVEFANARPKLIHARNQYRIAKSNLGNLLGYNIPPGTQEDIPLTLTGRLEAQPYPIELSAAIAQAAARRPELGVLRKAELLGKEGVVVARSTYRPSIGIFGGYGERNSRYYDDLIHDVPGAFAGVELTWAIFDGNLTRGKVMQAKALHEKAQFELADNNRRVELEVRTAYSSFLEAKEVLESQTKVQERAEEALRLAEERYKAGTGTQLDVLNAQTSLTEARTTQVQALHDYAVAQARLERAIGQDVPETTPGAKDK